MRKIKFIHDGVNSKTLLPFLLSWALIQAPIAMAEESGAQAVPDSPDKLLEEIEKFNIERKQLTEKEKAVARALEEQQKRMLEQQQKLQKQSDQILEQQRIYEEQKKRLDSLRLQIEELAQPPVAPIPSPTEPAVSLPAPPPAKPPSAPAPAPAPQPAPAPPAPAKKAPSAAESAEPPTTPVGQAPEEIARPKQVSDILDQRGILTPRGTLVVEPSVQYTHSSVTRVALEGFTIIPSITIGSIDIRAVSRNTVNAALGLRYGVSNRFEIEARAPYVSRSDTTTARPLAVEAEQDETVSAEGDGLGDLEIGLHYQLNRGGPGLAYYLANLRVKSRTGTDPFEVDTDPDTGLQTSLPTGSGFWGIQPSLTVSLPSDPAVFFGNVSYLWNLERTIDEETGTIDPGDAFGLSFGMGFAINQNASFSLGYSHSSVGKSKQNGAPIPGSENLQVGTLLFGASHRVGKSSNLSLSLGAGVTEDAPDVQITFRLPMSYRLF